MSTEITRDVIELVAMKVATGKVILSNDSEITVHVMTWRNAKLVWKALMSAVTNFVNAQPKNAQGETNISYDSLFASAETFCAVFDDLVEPLVVFSTDVSRDELDALPYTDLLRLAEVSFKVNFSESKQVADFFKDVARVLRPTQPTQTTS